VKVVRKQNVEELLLLHLTEGESRGRLHVDCEHVTISSCSLQPKLEPTSLVIAFLFGDLVRKAIVTHVGQYPTQLADRLLLRLHSDQPLT
jgi:hypothetical protein